ncbi:MAG TPA: tail fiber protein [Candidatus Elarobacter sp.]|jgi:microcystin-dependent protein|nr:tail fiber protein [Candidatus Elarobacter sp.]
MSSPFVAEIRVFPFNFAPRGWAMCNGQLLAISQNTALFSLLGGNYGGDMKVTFGLPNLQGSVAMHPGQGPGLSLHTLGETGGEPYVTLLQSEMPVHAHTISGDPLGLNAKQTSPQNNVPSNLSGVTQYNDTTTPNTTMSPFMASIAGGSQPHNNMMPYLTLNYCIALQGIYPARP